MSWYSADGSMALPETPKEEVRIFFYKFSHSVFAKITIIINYSQAKPAEEAPKEEAAAPAVEGEAPPPPAEE